MQRYRECHDLYHTLVGLPISVLTEFVLKYFEFANLRLPMTAISAIGRSLSNRCTKDAYVERVRSVGVTAMWGYEVLDLGVLVGEVDTRCNGNGGEAKGLESL